MRLRMYVTLPDLASARQLANDLLLARIEDQHMHFLARRGTDLGELHEASYLQKTDAVHGASTGLVIGGVVGVLRRAAAGVLPARRAHRAAGRRADRRAGRRRARHLGREHGRAAGAQLAPEGLRPRHRGGQDPADARRARGPLRGDPRRSSRAPIPRPRTAAASRPCRRSRRADSLLHARTTTSSWRSCWRSLAVGRDVRTSRPRTKRFTSALYQ